MSERKVHEPIQAMSRHVVTSIGIHIEDEACAPGLHLHLSPGLFDDDGHVAFGVLGSFVDLASSQADGVTMTRPLVHADIGLHRLARPQGELLLARTTTARVGGRTAVVEVDVTDETGTRVGYSSQQLVFMGPPPARSSGPSPSPLGRSEFRRAFLSRFDGTGTLDAPLLEALGVRAGLTGEGAPAWWMPNTGRSQNGFGGLHGGVATALVDVAAAGVVAHATGSPARTRAASLRYLVPGTAGPFRADPVVLGTDGDRSLVRVAVVDEGAGDQVIVLAEAHVGPGGAGR
jgi:uncharacterized protein (TIGR00369 family)